MPEALIVEDDPGFSAALAELVCREGFQTATAGSIKEARDTLNEAMPDVVFLDVELPDGSGMELLEEIGGFSSTEVVVITGYASIDAGVRAMQNGAANYLTKPIDLARVKALLAGVAKTRELKEQIGSLRSELRRLGRFGRLIGVSPLMQSLYGMIAKVAATDVTVLISGETGTGKEVVANSIHDLSRRWKQPFVPVNCGAFSANLIGSELFGHEKGSFTGADRQRRGCFENADKGTLFLDELTEMPIELQVDLLRVLETRKIRRIGGQQLIDVDVRVIAATSMDPAEAVSRQKLREDLLYRLGVFPIQIPTLKQRQDDVALIAEHLLLEMNREVGSSKRFTQPALDRIRAHTWPGNVRELKNVVRRAFILSEEDIGPEALPFAAEGSIDTGMSIKVGTALADAKRRLILATLEECAGDKRQAAAILGISLKTLYNRLNEYKGLPGAQYIRSRMS